MTQTLREKLAQIMYEDVICDTVYDDDIQRERAYVDDPYHAADAILAAVREALSSDAAVEAIFHDMRFRGVTERARMFGVTDEKMRANIRETMEAYVPVALEAVTSDASTEPPPESA